MDRFTHSSAPVKKVQAVQFGILDPDFIVSGDVCFDLVEKATTVSLDTVHIETLNSLPQLCSGDTLLSRSKLAKHMKRANLSLGA